MTSPQTNSVDPVDPSETQDEEVKSLLKDCLTDLADSYIRDEQFVRDTHLRIARRNDNYWRNLQDIWWDDEAKDWRTLEKAGDYLDDFDDNDLISRKYINIYKAHGESIIAALSNGVPATRFFPEDANNVDDVYTAEAFSKLASYLRKNNKAKHLVIKMLVTLFNEPFVAIHTYTDKNNKYGTYNKPVNGYLYSKHTSSYCSQCGELLDKTSTPPEAVDSPDSFIPNYGTNLEGAPAFCPSCNTATIPFEESEDKLEQGVVDYEQAPKSKAIQDCYGVLNVTIPAFATKIDEVPFLVLDTEVSTALAMELYDMEEAPTSQEDMETLFRWSRLNQDYQDQRPKYISNIRRVWFRNWAFNRIEDLEKRVKIKGLFPDGCLATFVDGDLVSIETEKLDDHWTISSNPLFRFLAGDAIGTALIPMQDAENDTFNLTLDTIAHGISETFVESGILNLDEYGNQQARPGMITSTLTAGNKSLGESFFQTKPANLSGEIAEFEGFLEKKSQFISGAFPSIYGGSLQNSGGTLGEYQESRNQALQRLQLVWALICDTWAEMEFKSIKDFVANTDYDVADVSKSGMGYMTTWIRRAHMNGNVNCLEPEANEAFPISWTQKKSVIDSLIQLKDPFIGSILTHPENVQDIAEIYGMSGLYIPGADDRSKQLAEISELLKGAPQQGPHGMLIPSVPVDPDVDNPQVHIETTRAWLVSETGQAVKRDNPPAYLNVLAHLKMHQQMMMPQQPPPDGNIEAPPQQEGQQ